MILQASGLIVGQPYWLLIDGSNGSTCQYTIEYTTGVFGPQLTGELDPVQTFTNLNVVSQGYQDLQIVTGPSIGNAHGYYWTFGWNNDTITTTLPELNINIAANAPPGIWNICVHAFSGCDTTENEICTQIEIIATTATETLKDETGISIFPNPTKDKLQIQLPEDTSLPVQWVLFDEMGIQQMNGTLIRSNTILDLEIIPAGVYFLELDLKNDFRRILKVINE
ncbi:MAG: T9SS type A sorting domain-containing protein [Saprospiraceae bacterium]|uniref:T9SS type A sorting domain-containing protein n=1 Tax=Candidatus Opimibacter skivensis TaxID=2982028 RepID=A0A9D7XUA5_9BACT|nr:T9SS type A sorting domain-containing protein [Candidatus Opimibacter skivensis]